jgi:hypothetical protein
MIPEYVVFKVFRCSEIYLSRLGGDHARDKGLIKMSFASVQTLSAA